MIDYNKTIDILNCIYAVDGNYQPEEIIEAINIAINCVKIEQKKHIVTPKPICSFVKHRKYKPKNISRYNPNWQGTCLENTQ